MTNPTPLLYPATDYLGVSATATTRATRPKYYADGSLCNWRPDLTTVSVGSTHYYVLVAGQATAPDGVHDALVAYVASLTPQGAKTAKAEGGTA